MCHNVNACQCQSHDLEDRTADRLDLFARTHQTGLFSAILMRMELCCLVHYLTLSIQLFVSIPRFRPLSNVPCNTVLEIPSWWVSWPNQVYFYFFWQFSRGVPVDLYLHLFLPEFRQSRCFWIVSRRYPINICSFSFRMLGHNHR